MPRMKDKNKHIHKLMKVIGKRVRAWRCMDDDCGYLVYSGIEQIVLGRITKCWGCGTSFKMNEENLVQEMPICVTCVMKERGINSDELTQFINKRIRLAESQNKLPTSTLTEFTHIDLSAPTYQSPTPSNTERESPGLTKDSIEPNQPNQSNSQETEDKVEIDYPTDIKRTESPDFKSDSHKQAHTNGLTEETLKNWITRK